MKEKRGIRNHNPGNIRHKDAWMGLASEQPDPSFCTFIEPKYGIRAMAKILLNYQLRHGLSTISGIINRWAPPTENNTHSYIQHVAHFVGVDSDAKITVADHLLPLVTAIILHENGRNPYTTETILEGIEMAKA